MRTEGMTLELALAHVREIAKPNEGFMQQLRLYEKGTQRTPAKPFMLFRGFALLVAYSCTIESGIPGHYHSAYFVS